MRNGEFRVYGLWLHFRFGFEFCCLNFIRHGGQVLSIFCFKLRFAAAFSLFRDYSIAEMEEPMTGIML